MRAVNNICQAQVQSRNAKVTNASELFPSSISLSVSGMSYTEASEWCEHISMRHTEIACGFLRRIFATSTGVVKSGVMGKERLDEEENPRAAKNEEAMKYERISQNRQLPSVFQFFSSIFAKENEVRLAKENKGRRNIVERRKLDSRNLIEEGKLKGNHHSKKDL
jgi:hypothetical protein